MPTMSTRDVVSVTFKKKLTSEFRTI